MVKVLASIGMLLTYTAAISAANTPRWVGCSKFESKIRYKKWCYFGAAKLLIFNTLIYEIVL